MDDKEVIKDDQSKTDDDDDDLMIVDFIPSPNKSIAQPPAKADVRRSSSNSSNAKNKKLLRELNKLQVNRPGESMDLDLDNRLLEIETSRRPRRRAAAEGKKYDQAKVDYSSSTITGPRHDGKGNLLLPDGKQYNICDCLNETCVGCFYECPKCGSTKCGSDCRQNRHYYINQIESEGRGVIIKNKFLQNLK